MFRGCAIGILASLSIAVIDERLLELPVVIGVFVFNWRKDGSASQAIFPDKWSINDGRTIES